jgi:hypothetical protein
MNNQYAGWRYQIKKNLQAVKIQFEAVLYLQAV